MTEPSLDILADLGGSSRRPPGYACVIDSLRRVNPALAEQFDKVVAAKRRHEIETTYTDIAKWFVGKDVQMSANTVGIHVRGQCGTCRRAES
jgi:hypothetical protein